MCPYHIRFAKWQCKFYRITFNGWLLHQICIIHSVRVASSKKKNRCMSIVHVRFRNYLQPYIGFLKLIISSIADVTIILFQVYTYTN